MRELRELKLPRLVEARKRQSAGSEFEYDLGYGHPLHLSQTSTTSSDHSPVTPTFSLRGHFRFPSSTSSLASSPTMRSSMDGFAAKRPLTEVREEPQEREGEQDMSDSPMRESEELAHAPSIVQLDRDHHSQADYDWVESPYGDEQFDFSFSKRRCPEGSAVGANDSAAARFGGSIKSLSRKLKSRKEKPISSIPDAFHESIVSRSRASSMRAASVIDSRSESVERSEPRQFYTTSAAESFAGFDEEPEESRSDPIDIQQSLQSPEESEATEAAARTPLLPPVLAMLTKEQEPLQSPLQSPKVAESPSVAQRDPFDSPIAWHGLPSPPLSTKPSTSSFHHRQIVPPSEIPPIDLGDGDARDEWTLKLGHANFTIYPEPYLPALPATASSRRQLRADWEAARCNYMQHLVRTGEHYSTTSEVHRKTEEKWATINAIWKTYHSQALASTSAVQLHNALDPSPQQPLPTALPPIIKIPSINGPLSAGKFPKVGDLGIVGPMEVIKPMPQRSLKKRTFWAFLQGMLPARVAPGRSQST